MCVCAFRYFPVFPFPSKIYSPLHPSRERLHIYLLVSPPDVHKELQTAVHEQIGFSFAYSYCFAPGSQGNLDHFAHKPAHVEIADRLSSFYQSK